MGQALQQSGTLETLENLNWGAHYLHTGEGEHSDEEKEALLDLQEKLSEMVEAQNTIVIIRSDQATIFVVGTPKALEIKMSELRLSYRNDIVISPFCTGTPKTLEIETLESRPNYQIISQSYADFPKPSDKGNLVQRLKHHLLTPNSTFLTETVSEKITFDEATIAIPETTPTGWQKLMVMIREFIANIRLIGQTSDSDATENTPK